MKPETKTVWIAWSNTDTTEGRGQQYPYCICETKTTAMRMGANGSVQGSDCTVEPFEAVKHGGYWCAPFSLASASQEDLETESRLSDLESALEQCRKAGVSTAAIETLKKGLSK